MFVEDKVEKKAILNIGMKNIYKWRYKCLWDNEYYDIKNKEFDEEDGKDYY